MIPALAFVAFGSNLGDPAAQLRRAAGQLQQLPQVSGFRGSSIYRSPAMGGPEQPDYCNAVAQIDWDGDAEALLKALMALESAAGRRRQPGLRNTPRTLDLDLLLFADQILDLPQLQIPHPRMLQRAFVLVPLAELSPELVIPGHGSIGGYLPRVVDQVLERLPGLRLGADLRQPQTLPAEL
ncbi:MAG: 2-amino-4-hydroxy-6-hydroxymethyldihydropteridine diphosphokinase [Xanthomonadales bacterium]|nr:2-amino-4-hydroxy-6-hydroxymethyldihydropteridine diphosphokinase [Xanthomonadales bacterium]